MTFYVLNTRIFVIMQLIEFKIHGAEGFLEKVHFSVVKFCLGLWNFDSQNVYDSCCNVIYPVGKLCLLFFLLYCLMSSEKAKWQLFVIAANIVHLYIMALLSIAADNSITREIDKQEK